MILPSTRYHRTEKPRIIHTEAEHDELHEAGWRDTPAAFEFDGDPDKYDDDASDDATRDDVNREAALAPAKPKRKR